jgi:hypothetical protein
LKEKEFQVGKQKGKCRFVFCSDGKFLNCVLGMTCAMGTFSCPFCFVPNTMWGAVYAGKLSSDDYLRESFLMMSRCVPHCPKHLNRCKGDSHGCEKENLLIGLFELEDVFLDELHLFLRLWDLLLNILLGYIEPWGCEDALEAAAKKAQVCFHMLDGLDSKDYQLWTPLTGDKSKKLLDAFVDHPEWMREVFLVGERAKLIPHDSPKELEEKTEAHEMLFEAIYSLFVHLRKIIDYVRDDRKTLKTIKDFESEVDAFIDELYSGWGEAIKKGWYLHMLKSHIPAQMDRLGGTIYLCSCSDQERLNGKHTKLLLHCIQKQNSSEQLFRKEKSEIFFTLHPEKVKQRNNYTKGKINNRKSKRFTSETMDQHTKSTPPHKDRKKRTTTRPI